MANQLLGWLSGGDLRSDGQATEVAELVLDAPDLFPDLVAGLDEPDDVVRGRTADALEKISRSRPELVNEHLGKILLLANHDPVPMVRWHLVMVLGYLSIVQDNMDRIFPVLREMLGDESVFVRCWVVTSLAIIGKKYESKSENVAGLLSTLTSDPSPALRTRARKALEVLTHENKPFPKEWIKSEHLRDL
jgi:HEAT repeat protein